MQLLTGFTLLVASNVRTEYAAYQRFSEGIFKLYVDLGY
jgi:hypothetical protein